MKIIIEDAILTDKTLYCFYKTLKDLNAWTNSEIILKNVVIRDK